MKKITLLLTLFSFAFVSGQSYTSGVINFATIGGINYTAVIETDTQNVKLTLTGPSTRYLAIGFGVNAMSSGGDVLIFDGSSLTDRTFVGNALPTLDVEQTWNITSNTVASGVRTIVATRALNSGQPNNFVFSNSGQPIMMVWAAANSNSFNLAYHGSTRGATMSNFTLSQNAFDLSSFGIYPNPANSVINLDLPESVVLVDFIIYDMTGKKILQKQISNQDTSIDVSVLSKGSYISRIESEGNVASKILIIN